MKKRLTQQEFITRSIAKHVGYYSYENVSYINVKVKVNITCPIHGSFFQTPNKHLSGCGCPSCKFDKISGLKRHNVDIFVDKAKTIHGDKYNYSKALYKNTMTKIEIICDVHGSFFQTPSKHLSGCGCPCCKSDKIANVNRGCTSTFIKTSQIVHKNIYDYSKVEYIHSHVKVEIICSVHGSFFQTPTNHLEGYGCVKCSSRTSKGEKRLQYILENLNITYKREKTFPDLYGITSNRRLKYDFWLPDFNTLIEYDGEHHFFPINFSGTLTKKQTQIQHENTVTNDTKKDRYALLNKYKLIRIPYTDFNSLDKAYLQQKLNLLLPVLEE